MTSIYHQLPEFDEDKDKTNESSDDYIFENNFEKSFIPFGTESSPLPSKQKQTRTILIIAISVILAAGLVFAYFIFESDFNQETTQTDFDEIKSLEEQNLASQYGVGELGSDHAHAAVVVFVDGEQIDFGLSQFQLKSSYVHFENHNSYQVHRHATNVPLEMLFNSIVMKITANCIILNNYSKDYSEHGFCTDDKNSLKFYINGEQTYSDISQYVFEHNDRILLSFGESENPFEQLEYVKSLKIYDIPKYEGNQDSKDEIFI